MNFQSMPMRKRKCQKCDCKFIFFDIYKNRNLDLDEYYCPKCGQRYSWDGNEKKSQAGENNK